jgi:uncharacterized protein (TIGR02391 family)
MTRLPELIPDPETLLALSPDELARSVLIAAAASSRNGLITPDQVIGRDALCGGVVNNGQPVYPPERFQQISRAGREAWQWLEVNLLVMPAEGINGNNGWRVLTRRGENLVSDEARYRTYAGALGFPKTILHPTIADDVWLDIARGDLATAVFRAFRAVEEAVRIAGNFGPNDIGVDLMRRAFNPETGPLTKLEDPISERQALASLFAGAIGSYKNPHSHRTVEIREARDAQEMVVLASHLLRIVDERRAQT